MKKILTVMLIAVMAAGFVFAGLSGVVQSSYTFGKDGGWNKGVVADKDGNPFDPAALALFKWAETYKTEEVEGVHAEVEAKATLTVKGNITADSGSSDNISTEKTDESKVDVNGVKLDTKVTAKIVAGDVVVKIGDSYGVDYAKSWNLNLKTNKVDSFATALNSDKKGVEVDYKGARLGVSNKSVYVETPELEVAGVKAQAAAILKDGDASVSAKASYTSDVVSVAVACDANLPKATTKDASKTAYDARATVKVGFVTVDAFKGEFDYKYADTLEGKKELQNVEVHFDELDLQAVADLASFEVPAKLTVSVTGLCNAAEDNQYVLAAEYEDTVEASVEVAFVPGETVKWGVGFKAPVDIFTVSASFSEEHDMEVLDHHTAVKAIKPSVVVSTDKLVAGADLAFGWYDANLVKANFSRGFIAASCTIEF